MRSTPIFLDGSLYHLRYDLNSVWDLEHLLPDGFNSIVSSDINPELCKLLLWSGLKWEAALTVSDTDQLIKNEQNAVENKSVVLVGIIKSCLDELFQSGWYNKPSGNGSGKSLTIKELIFALEKAAYYCEYPGDPWNLTPNEINFFVVAFNDRHKNDESERNFRMGMICASLFNSAGKFKHGHIPFEWRDFIPSGPQTEEDMLNILLATAAALGAEKK